MPRARSRVRLSDGVPQETPSQRRALIQGEVGDLVVDGVKRGLAEDRARRLRSLEAQAERLEAENRETRRKLAELKTERRDRILNQAIREGRIFESARATWERRYEEDPELVRQTFDDLNPRAHEIVGRLFTRADFGETVDAVQEERRALAARLGITVEEVL